jgi:holo-[acyl-carrier protein] synthase
MLIGVGTDILKISNIEKLVSDISDPFIQKTYTKNELLLIKSRPIPKYCFATRFAGKEAVFKTLSADGNSILLNQIEILENKQGQPLVILYGEAKAASEKRKITNILLSLSYDGEYAVAYASAVNDNQ